MNATGIEEANAKTDDAFQTAYLPSLYATTRDRLLCTR
jgi:hypothetical protein